MSSNFLKDIKDKDPELAKSIINEHIRQEEGLELIPSENNVSKAVLQAMGSILTNKYSEGYPKKRYYGGQVNIDVIEQLAIDRAKKLFGVEYVNVQPYSGSPANLAVCLATCNPGDPITGLSLISGGHLTHGHSVNATAIYYNSKQYDVGKDGYLDFESIASVIRTHKPKLIWCGTTAYSRIVPFEKFAKLADEIGAYLVADIAHISGLVAAGVHPSPVPYVHIITTTTHKTLRGPRGGMIMVTKKGLDKDPDLGKKIDKAVFPGLQGGPHDHTTAGIAVALQEALSPEFKGYAEQIVKNSKSLAKGLIDSGITLVTGGTDNHLILIDLTPFGPGKGYFVQEALDIVGMTVNKNTIPSEPFSPFYPSGIRLGTPSITTRGMKETESYQIGIWMSQVIKEVASHQMPKDPEARKVVIADFKKLINENQVLKSIRKEVYDLCKKYPLYNFDILQ